MRGCETRRGGLAWRFYTKNSIKMVETSRKWEFYMNHHTKSDVFGMKRFILYEKSYKNGKFGIK